MPPKVKESVWLVIKGRILTKDNLRKKGWTGMNICEFCGARESIDHLLFTCSFARFFLERGLWCVR